MTVREAVVETERRLAAAGVDTPRVDAEWLLAHVLGVPRARIFEQENLDAAALEPLVRRREQREPLAYVLGEWGFRNLTLKTDRRALVPRPETEIVVERALALLDGLNAPRVVDIGVGSGAIALAIKDERRDAHVTGVDVSADALSLARENAERLRLDVELRRGGADVAAEGWDLVVANPPYIAQGALTQLQPELQWEPYEALADNGLHDEIIQAAQTAWLVLEVGLGQARQVERVMSKRGYGRTRITRDLAGIERIVEGKRDEQR